MKAVRFHRHGGPEVLQYEDAPDPVRGPDQVLVRVKACGLNHLDIWGRMGPPYSSPPLPHILGCDIAGTVEEAPPDDDEEGLRRGAEVIVSPGIGCGRCERCLSGSDNQCRRYKIIGNGPDGGYAELVAVPEEERAAEAGEDGLRPGRLGPAGLPDSLPHARDQGEGSRRGRLYLSWERGPASG